MRQYSILLNKHCYIQNVVMKVQYIYLFFILISKANVSEKLNKKLYFLIEQTFQIKILFDKCYV